MSILSERACYVWFILWYEKLACCIINLLYGKKYHDSRGDNVQIMVIPDIKSVNWGRGVGYEVNEYFPPEHLEAISATEIRNHIKDGADDWKEFVDEVLQKDVETYLSNVIFPE